MKYKIPFFIFLLSFIVSSGQTVLGNISFQNSKFQKKDCENSFLNIYYQFSIYSIDTARKKENSTICILQIGKEATKFVDINQIKLDSIKMSYENLKTIGTKEINEILKTKVSWPKTIFVEKEKIIVQSDVSNLFQYEEPKNNFKWELQNGEKTISGYVCKKASVKFRGREYTAWYAKDLNVNSGPYKFYGLPGLILEIFDSENIFHFEAIAMNDRELPIYLIENSRVIHTTEKKYKELEKNYHENPGAFLHGKAYDENGKQIVMKMKPIPYNPIELE
jgi:GLPGLI family protein